MMNQLGINNLRPGRNGQNQTGEGFDEATANPYKDTMPDVLTMKDGTKVTPPDQWPKRRAEISGRLRARSVWPNSRQRSRV